MVDTSNMVTLSVKPLGASVRIPVATWCTTEDRLKRAEGYALVLIYILYGSDKTTKRRTYYWPLPPMKEVKGYSKG